MKEDGRPPLFESGAIVLDVATRSGKLLPREEAERAKAICWLFAALNSVEPYFADLARIDFFEQDEEVKSKCRPAAVKAIEGRLEQLSAALGSRDYLVADSFTIADLMMTSVFKILGHTDLLARHPTLVAYRDRCFARPAYVKAIADQCAEIDAHEPADMKWEQPDLSIHEQRRTYDPRRRM
jgi:glutathione S-transferase